MFEVFTRIARIVQNLRTIVIDGLSFFAAVWRRRTALAAENLFFAQTVGSIPGTGEESDAHDSCRQICIVQTGSLVRLAYCVADRETSHFDRLASQRVPTVLALEIETGRKATSDGRGQELDPAFSG